MIIALAEPLPQLQPLTDVAREMVKNAATGIPMFVVSLVITGFLFCPAPFVKAIRELSHRILPARGQAFVKLAGATIRNVSQGLIGIALLQPSFLVSAL